MAAVPATPPPPQNPEEVSSETLPASSAAPSPAVDKSTTRSSVRLARFGMADLSARLAKIKEEGPQGSGDTEHVIDLAEKSDAAKSELEFARADLAAKTADLTRVRCEAHKLDMDLPVPSSSETAIPQSSDARKTKSMSEMVGIPEINLESIIEIVEEPPTESTETVDVSSEAAIEVPSETVVDATTKASETPGDEEGWTEVSGKRSSPSRVSSSVASSSSNLLQLTVEDVASEIQYWDTVVVCYVLGSNPPRELVSGFVKKIWGVYKFDKISFFPNGVFLVRFPTKECQSLVLQQGFSMYDNKPLVVKPWTESVSLVKERVKSVPIWLPLCGLPLKFWGKSSLEKLVGLIGKFIKRDEATEYRTRLGYARLLVEVDVGQEFPDKLYFKDEKGQEVSILVEYEWKPTVCGACKGIGHTMDMCKKRKIEVPAPKPPQKVWRPKPVVTNKQPVPDTVVNKLPFRGPVYHNSSNLIPVSVLQQVSRQEHVQPSARLSPSKSNAAVVSINSGVITAHVTKMHTGDQFMFSVVYGFNEEDQRIGRDVTWNEISDFRDFVHYCGLTDIKGQGAFFTWNNKQDPASREFSRIDRFLINDDWMNLYPTAYAHFLPEGLFDHNPCVCYRRQVRDQRRPQFKYYNMWSLDAGFKEVVATEWNRDVQGVAKAILEDLQLQMHQNPHDLHILAAESEAAKNYKHLSQVQHRFLCQKAKLEWSKFGDENSRFFHSHIRTRQIQNRVMYIRGTDGILCTNPPDIEAAFLNYYRDLLGTNQVTTPVHFPTVRTGNLITKDHEQILLSSVTAEEIKANFFSIPGMKSPGPDGYTSEFYKDSWEIVGDKTVDAIQDFFRTGKLLKQINTTTLTLIPKVPNPVSVLEFRPIACCNVVYKVIAKVLCSRPNKILPSIINESQGGFVNGRNIVENVLICQDLVRLYNRKSASPRCLIKIDLRKPYDSVEWSFLEQMLHAFKFPQKFIELVMTCVTSPTYSLAVNGSHFGFFPGKRGLRQGDPLSPLLFTLCMEYLSRILGVVSQQDGFRFHPLCGHTRLNHLLFADDLLMFFKGTESSIMWILRSFSIFSHASGLTMNKDKTEIYFNGVSSTIIDNILHVSGFHQGILPFKYLGVPISAKKLTKNDGTKLTDRIVARIRSLGNKHISYAGRLILVQSVLSSLHTYWATIFLIPNRIIKKINAICRNFLWGGGVDYKRAPNVNWDIYCSSKEEGGLGIKDSKSWNIAFLGKYVWWLAQKKDHLWVRWVNHVYMKHLDWSDYTAPADCTWTWKKIASTIIKFQQAYTHNKWLNGNSDYTVRGGYDWLRGTQPKVAWKFICWNTLNMPKTSFIFWAIMHKRLLTKDRMIRMGISVLNVCDICGEAPEDYEHLFSSCKYTKLCVCLLQRKVHVQFKLPDLIVWFSKGRGVTKLQRRFVGACHVALFYRIWMVRNEVRFNGYVQRPEVLIQQILAEVMNRFQKLNDSTLHHYDRDWLRSL
ncbi:uncharacterized protein LOC141607978 [Silene latifolia]|uniref:uncharacterized protein LOC141607978 n=1 Tax=Silene latifolia TaxID=37657 RepID=UPI003D7745D7